MFARLFLLLFNFCVKLAIFVLLIKHITTVKSVDMQYPDITVLRLIIIFILIIEVFFLIEEYKVFIMFDLT